MHRLVLSTAVFLILAGCTAYEPQVRQDAPLNIPQHYSLYFESDPGPDHWWEAFGSTELNLLVEEALSNNFDIQTAWARLKQADAVARQAGASLMPSLNYSADGEKSWLQAKTSSDSGTNRSEEDLWRLGLAASYEVDLWGKLKAQREAEGFNFQAAREDLDTAAVTVAAAVVQAWIDIMATRDRISILHKQIKINTTLLELQKLRFANGQAKALDVAQQRQALAAAKSEFPLLQLGESQLLNSLALLLGRGSASGLSIEQSVLPELVALPATGLPADLLASRPDVRAAGLRLQSADWEVSAARADRLPSINLSAQAAFSSGGLDVFFSNWIASLAAGITGPLFDAGRRKAEVMRTRAVVEERLAGYAQTVAEAIREVEDSLVTEVRQEEYIYLLEDQLKAARLTLKNAQIQYQNGQSDYLSYLVAWTSVQGLELQIIGERAALVKNRVTLYRALGGDWTSRLVFHDPWAAGGYSAKNQS